MTILRTSVAPRVRLRIESKRSLPDAISHFGRLVYPRSGPRRRTHDQKEDFCLRGWVVAMAALDRLPLPVTIEGAAAGQAPDFVLRWDNTEDPLGIEITEAGAASWQAWLTRTERNEGATLLPAEDGYAGDSIERAAVRDVIEAIDRKVAAAGGAHYAQAARCDLLIYVNSEGGFMADQARVIARLRGIGSRPGQRWSATFRRIHLLFGAMAHIDIFGNDYASVNLSGEYTEDWVGWLKAQAEALRKNDIAKIDLENLREELESLGRSDERALKSQMRRLLTHLLKWRFQRRRRSRSWIVTIGSARSEIGILIEESPSLTARLHEFLPAQYRQAREEAARETRLPDNAFPLNCPFSVDQLLDRDFLPEA